MSGQRWPLEPNGLVHVINELRLDTAQFAELVGVDQRSVLRWTQGKAKPSGAAAEVVLALGWLVRPFREDSAQVIALRKIVAEILAHGGLRHMLITLLKREIERGAS